MKFVFIPFMRGATSYEGQIWRFGWHIPYWTYLKCGCKPSFYITDTDGNIVQRNFTKRK